MTATTPETVSAAPSLTPSRKVSIITDLNAYDNPSFEQPRSRKVSSNSEHAEVGPVRKKSILHNSQFSENFIKENDGN